MAFAPGSDKPLAFFRDHLNNYQVSTASQLALIDNEANVKVTGLVTCRQRPLTAAGVIFLTLEDESGFINVVVWPNLGEKLRPVSYTHLTLPTILLV